MDKKAVLHFLKPTLRKIILVPVLAGLTFVYMAIGSGLIGALLILPLAYPLVLFELLAPTLPENVGFAIVLANWYLVACAISSYMDRPASRADKDSRREMPFLEKPKFWA